MTKDTEQVDTAALDTAAAIPGSAAENAEIHHPRQNAGQDESIAERLARDPESPDAMLDTGLDESMDASDPIANPRPGGDHAAPDSTGYDAAAEAKRANATP